MDWIELEERFHRMLEEAGDWDAEWYFDPDRKTRQQWQLVGGRSEQHVPAILEALSLAGSHLRRMTEKGSLVPKKLVAEDVLNAEAWLNAIRYLRINVFQTKSETNWRCDQGRILCVVHASAQLCVRARVMESKNGREHAHVPQLKETEFDDIQATLTSIRAKAYEDTRMAEGNGNEAVPDWAARVQESVRRRRAGREAS